MTAMQHLAQRLAASAAEGLPILYVLIMLAICNRADHYIFCPVVSICLLSFFFPRLISAIGDWMSTILPHMVRP